MIQQQPDFSQNLSMLPQLLNEKLWVKQTAELQLPNTIKTDL